MGRRQRASARGAPYGEVQAAFVHHTVSANDYAAAGVGRDRPRHRRYHRDSNGWNDIGYNFLVDSTAVFEGRAGGIDQAVIGAQAQGWNSVSTGIACIGTFTPCPSEAGLEALAQLIGWKLSLHSVPSEGQVTLSPRGGATNRYPSGTPVTLERIPGHRDGDSTSCPGEVLYAQLADLRARATRYAGPLAGDDRPRVEHPHPQPPREALRPARASPTAPRPPAPRSTSSSPSPAPPSRASPATVCAPDGSWAASVPLTVSGLIRAAFRGRRRPAAAGVLPGRDPRPPHAPARPLVPPHPPRPGDRDLRDDLAHAGERRVEIRLERLVGRRWVRVQRKRIVVRGGRYLTRARLRRKGLYRVSVLVPGASRHLRVRAL